MNNLASERLQSLKIGLISSLTFGLVYAISSILNIQMSISTGNNWIWTLAIALLSGFLFGVTYRYVAANQENPFLKDGVVLAFTLVRGLAPIEIIENLTQDFWLLIILVIESFFGFASVRLMLDWGFSRNRE